MEQSADTEIIQILPDEIKTSVPVLSYRQLVGGQNDSEAWEKMRQLDFSYIGASGKTAKLELGSAQASALGVQAVAIKIPDKGTNPEDIRTEKEILEHLSDLWGQGVVRLVGTIPWGPPRFGVVKEWIEGRILGPGFVTNWSRMESGQKLHAEEDDVETAKLVLSFFDIIGKIHERKVILGDLRLADVIWDGAKVTLIDFAQSFLGQFNPEKDRWEITAQSGRKEGFDQAVRQQELPDMVRNIFLQGTSLKDWWEEGDFLVSQEKISGIQNSVLREIAQKNFDRRYQNTEEITADLVRYFLSIGMTAEQLGLPLRITSEEIDDTREDIIRVE